MSQSHDFKSFLQGVFASSGEVGAIFILTFLRMPHDRQRRCEQPRAKVLSTLFPRNGAILPRHAFCRHKRREKKSKKTFCLRDGITQKRENNGAYLGERTNGHERGNREHVRSRAPLDCSAFVIDYDPTGLPVQTIIFNNLNQDLAKISRSFNFLIIVILNLNLNSR